MTTAALAVGQHGRGQALDANPRHRPGDVRDPLAGGRARATCCSSCPAPAATVGDVLVRDPRVAMIAFTGSKEVGLSILRAAGETPEGQPFVKKVVCEMGGKNAIIVDDSADLDEAVLGVRQSAFGYCGQKCSACSRAIVLDGVYDHFLERLVESTRTLVIGDPADARHRPRPGDRRGRRGEDPRVHRDRQARRPAGAGLRSARRAWPRRSASPTSGRTSFRASSRTIVWPTRRFSARCWR